MALFKFTKPTLAGEPIQAFNYGKYRWDFTYIGDIVERIIRILDRPARPNREWNSALPYPGTSKARWRAYNIGRNSPVEPLDYIGALQSALGKKATMELLPLQAGHVPDTYADVEELVDQFRYNSATSVCAGITRFVAWYRDYFKV